MLIGFTAGAVLARQGSGLSDAEQYASRGTEFDVFVGGGDLVEWEPFGDGDPQVAVEECGGELGGGVGFDLGGEIVAAEQAQGGVGEPERPVGDAGRASAE